MCDSLSAELLTLLSRSRGKQRKLLTLSQTPLSHRTLVMMSVMMMSVMTMAVQINLVQSSPSRRKQSTRAKAKINRKLFYQRKADAHWQPSNGCHKAVAHKVSCSANGIWVEFAG